MKKIREFFICLFFYDAISMSILHGVKVMDDQ